MKSFSWDHHLTVIIVYSFPIEDLPLPKDGTAINSGFFCSLNFFRNRSYLLIRTSLLSPGDVGQKEMNYRN